MNLRREESNIESQVNIYNIGDPVKVVGSEVTGKILTIGKWKDKTVYTIALDKAVSLGYPCKDTDIKVLKPTGLNINTINCYEKELTLLKKYKHILLPSSHVQTIQVENINSFPAWDNNGDGNGPIGETH